MARGRPRSAWADAFAWLELPPDVWWDVPRVETVGRAQVRLTNHRGLVRYAADQVVADLPEGHGQIRIVGQDLVIGWLSREELLVTGLIRAIRFENT
ncbi:MAG: sporulation protein YqfC [Actinomycetia bacterium]|nr:sporulation protein YqfC [Actinomycetes bacterium]